MNEKNEMPTGSVACRSGIDTCRPRCDSEFVTLTLKNP